MNFNSYEYAAFFAIVLLAFWSVPRRAKLPIVLTASYVFYGSLDWRFLGLLLLSTIIDFNVARAIHRRTRRRDRQRWLLVSVFSHLAILGYFKYANFFYEGFRDAFEAMGLSPSEFTLQVALPVGVSFYTFQSLAYTIDVYRRKIDPCDDPVLYAAFVSFFPQLLAGPIERAGHLLPQLANLRSRLQAVEVREGIDLMLLGLFKKVAVADVMGRLVDDVYGTPDPFRNGILTTPAEPGWLSLALAAFALSMQIYCDFSGYSDLARGTAKLLGIDISRNFRRPFWATSYRDFWRRWHITLMAWFRDYVYIPLGGSRVGRAHTYANLLIVFGLSGLWHGATGGFVVWGLLNGAVVCLETAIAPRWRAARQGKKLPASATQPHFPSDAVDYDHLSATTPVPTDGSGVALVTLAPAPPTDGAPAPTRASRFGGRVYVNVVYALITIPLGTATLGVARDVWSGIFTLRSGPIVAGEIVLVAYAALMVVATDIRQRALERTEDSRRSGQPPSIEAPLRWALISGGMIAGIVMFSGTPVEPFFYFQF